MGGKIYNALIKLRRHIDVYFKIGQERVLISLISIAVIIKVGRHFSRWRATCLSAAAPALLYLLNAGPLLHAVVLRHKTTGVVLHDGIARRVKAMDGLSA